MDNQYWNLYHRAKEMFIHNIQKKLIDNAESNRDYVLKSCCSGEEFPSVEDFEEIKLRRPEFPLWTISDRGYYWEVRNYYSCDDKGNAVLIFMYPGMYPSSGYWMPDKNYKPDLDFYFSLEQLWKIRDLDQRLKELKILLWDYSNLF